MSDIQKNKLSRLLKVHKKTKRELSKFLDVHENGINRLLSNSNITIKRLQEIAEFIGIDYIQLVILLYGKESKAYDERYDDITNIVADSDTNDKQLYALFEDKRVKALIETLNIVHKSSLKLSRLLLSLQQKAE